ncbi:MAG: lamin tail domain-containing protein [Planctomycetota bacterium]
MKSRFCVYLVMGFSCLSMSLCGLPLRAAETILIPVEAQWRYLRGLEEASSPDPASWRLPDFDDSAWTTAPAAFGFGEPGLRTDLSELEPPMRRNYTCIFLRKTFEVASLATLESYTLSSLYDDGFLVWINGNEVLRVNMPGETGDFVPVEEDAMRSHEAREFEDFVLPDIRDSVVEGTNLLAIQAFNVSATSSDFVFEMSLVDPFGPDITPPTLASTIPSPGSVVRRLSQVEIFFDEPVGGVDAADLLVNGASAASVRGSDAGPYVFSFEQPEVGEVIFSWRADSAIADRAETPNFFQGGIWSCRLDPDAPLDPIVISELLASNRSGLRDEDGDSSDWIELHNEGASAVGLGGWALSDDDRDLARWVLPDVTIEADGYLVVFASGKDRRDPREELHTNFSLSSDGEGLYLSSAESPRTVIYRYESVPPQRPDYSYGVGAGGQIGYFFEPSPGEENSDAQMRVSFVEDPVFNFERGLYDEGFSLDISTATEGARIYYTLDGEVPTSGRGELYTGPSLIDGSGGRAVVTIRTAAYKDGYLPSNIITHSYIFSDRVLSQPVRPAGFPAGWTGAPRADYEMDPQIADNPAYSASVREGLRSLPSISIVARVADVFGSQGIYSNPGGTGSNWERPCSVEYILPDGSEGFQIDCGIRILGGASRNTSIPKHSFRLLFKSDYGRPRLKYELFEGNPVSSFDTLVLRANYNNSWVHWDGGQRRRAMLIRDQFAKDTTLDMGQPGAYGRFVNLYVGGLYWGVFNLVERPSAPFAADHMGGEKEEWDALNSGNAIDGNAAAWGQVHSAAAGVGGDAARLLALREQLDIENLIDYLLLNYYGGNHDWDNHNWYAARHRVEGGQWRFFSWDAERILEGIGDNRLNVNEGNAPTGIHNRLRNNSEYRLIFADRIHRHFFNGGALTPEATAARFLRRADEVEVAVACESARWGDYRRDVHQWRNGPYEFYRPDSHWLVEKNRLLATYFPRRSEQVLRTLTSAGLYPRISAPVFSRRGGLVEPGFGLAMTRPVGQQGEIYYTLDGSDPRVPVSGAVSGAAVRYSAAVTISDYTIVKARLRAGAQWSALNEAVFTLPPVYESLHISELMYHPPGGQEFEFIELENSGELTIDLSGLAFTNGIEFSFQDGEVLPPGERYLLVADEAVFQEAFPDAPVRGEFGDSLSNGGEKLTLKDGEGLTLVSVDYDDDGFWPISADGYGRSLVLADLEGDPDRPLTWRPSAEIYGSPGRANGAAGVPAVWINEVVNSAGGGVELYNPSAIEVDVSGWQLSDGLSGAGALPGFQLPADSLIPAGGYLVISEAALRTTVSLSASGGDIYLSSPVEPAEWIVGVGYGPAEGGGSSGIWVHSTGRDFTALESPTLGAGNSSPRVGAVVVNEIHYHPAADPEGPEPMEFVEFFNRTEAEQPLYDSERGAGWRLNGPRDPADENDFIFPPGASIPPRGFLLLVSGDPAVFRARRQVPAGVVVVGPFAGGLANDGERLTLSRPWADAELIVDHVRYNDRSPWPAGADGGGASLERVSISAYGNEAANWGASLAAGGTPGRLNSIAEEDEPGGWQVPGDFSQDGRLDLTDAVALLGFLFQGTPAALPCGDGTVTDPANLSLLDDNADGGVNLSDAVYVLVYLFSGGPPPVAGADCLQISGCEQVCGE